MQPDVPSATTSPIGSDIPVGIAPDSDAQTHGAGQTDGGTDLKTSRVRTFETEIDDATRRIPGMNLDLLHKAKVLVLGVGAIGNELVKNLALYNIGNLYLCDMDTVEWANLSHSVLFRETDDGKPKVEAAERQLKEINRLVRVKPFYSSLSHIGLGVWQEMDVIVGCLDNRGSRLLIDRMCARAGKDWIDAGLGTFGTPDGIFQGTVQVFSPRNGYSYEYYLQNDLVRQGAEREADDANRTWRNWPGCAALVKEAVATDRVPTTPSMAALVGALQAQEVVRYLCPDAWGGQGLKYRSLTINAAKFTCDVKENPRSLPKDPLVNLVQVPKWSAMRTTVGEVTARAKRDLGPNARVHLGFQYCSGLECSVCHTIDARPFRMGMFSEICPVCKQARGPIIGTQMPGELDGTESFPDLTLYQLGVPPYDVLTATLFERVHRGPSRLVAEVNYELTGDRDATL